MASAGGSDELLQCTMEDIEKHFLNKLFRYQDDGQPRQPPPKANLEKTLVHIVNQFTKYRKSEDLSSEDEQAVGKWVDREDSSSEDEEAYDREDSNEDKISIPETLTVRNKRVRKGQTKKCGSRELLDDVGGEKPNQTPFGSQDTLASQGKKKDKLVYAMGIACIQPLSENRMQCTMCNKVIPKAKDYDTLMKNISSHIQGRLHLKNLDDMEKKIEKIKANSKKLQRLQNNYVEPRKKSSYKFICVPCKFDGYGYMYCQSHMKSYKHFTKVNAYVEALGDKFDQFDELKCCKCSKMIFGVSDDIKQHFTNCEEDEENPKDRRHPRNPKRPQSNNRNKSKKQFQPPHNQPNNPSGPSNRPHTYKPYGSRNELHEPGYQPYGSRNELHEPGYQPYGSRNELHEPGYQPSGPNQRPHESTSGSTTQPVPLMSIQTDYPTETPFIEEHRQQHLETPSYKNKKKKPSCAIC